MMVASHCIKSVVNLFISDLNAAFLSTGRKYPLPESKIKHYMYQLCKSLDHMHR